MVLLIKTSQQKVFLSFSNSESIFRITGYQTDYIISRKAHVKKTIAVACDHAGFELKECVIDTIKKTGCDVIDVGTYSKESADFPDYVKLGSDKIINGKAEAGVFICGSGVGVCIAANKIPGIYASVCHDTYSAHQGVEHDGMNVLCLGSRIIGSEVARELVTAFLNAKFNNKPNQIRRFEKIKSIERGDFSVSNKIERILELGQSIWYDNIQRCIIRNGELKEMIQRGEIRGLTSNPCSFRKAISDSNDYDTAIAPMALAGWNCEKIFSQLSVEDIRDAASLFTELYVQTDGKDGYVSLEINPSFSHETEKIVAEARKTWTAVNRPNLMVKIPATESGISAVRQLVSAGINVNSTLIFSEEQYIKAAEAYISGLEDRIASGQPINKIQSVASVYVCWIDSKIDPLLEKIITEGSEEQAAIARELKGKVGIANCQRIYRQFKKIFSGERFNALQKKGATIQRPLWAATGCKNDQYSDTIYIDSLIGENTISSVDPETLKAALDHGCIKAGLPASDNEIDLVFSKLASIGISLQNITEELQEEGVNTFENAFNSMLGDLNKRSDILKKSLGDLYDPVMSNFKKIEENSILPRIFAKDPTVWTFDIQAYPEIRNRLGWLDAHMNTAKNIEEFRSILKSLKENGIRKVLLLGMGGSSLAPEVMALTFKEISDLKLEIVDSTDPGQVLEADHSHPTSETVYIISSKSGGTAEVRALLDYFYQRAKDTLGEKAGSHFIAITDPGTQLERIAKELNFRNIVLSDPAVGGRFSAITPFGVLPATLIGIDPAIVLEKVNAIAKKSTPSNPVASNEGAALGVYMGTAALLGRDKFTILTDPELESFGSWLEQLIAESSGKNGKGIIPVDIEPQTDPSVYAKDRAFVYIQTSGTQCDFIDQLMKVGQPVLTIKLNDLPDLFAEFYRWEIAISVACSLLEVNAFDQPNVQDSKNRTVAKINEYKEKGVLSEPEVLWEKDGVKVFYSLAEAANETLKKELAAAKNPAEFISKFLTIAHSGEDYVAINAYLPRNEDMLHKLQSLRKEILKQTACATTLGFGPRFQHSTGQLHKGGANNGVFIQIVANSPTDVEIPNEGMTFAVLERAQALGDFEALMAVNRRAVRIDLGNQSPSILLKK
jgi:transaldolase/glucose-6-phosphate isomerase